MIPEPLKRYDYRDNLVVDVNNPLLIQKAWRDRHSGKACWDTDYWAKAYLGRKHGEDALTWNIFRSLQLAGDQGLKILSDIFEISPIRRMLFWGCDVEHQGDEQQLLNILIRTLDGRYGGTMTEPDLVLITGKEVVFVECKLNLTNRRNSPWRAADRRRGAKEWGAEKRMDTYIEKFPELAEFKGNARWASVYQLIRQYVYSKSLAQSLNKNSFVIPLINEEHKDALSPWYSLIKSSDLFQQGLFKDFLTWQDILSTIKNSNLPLKNTLLCKISEALKNAENK